jgi:purine-binding chemotaxis protein CheW
MTTATMRPTPTQPHSIAATSDEYLTLTIENNQYAVHREHVQDFISRSGAQQMPLPHAPRYIPGTFLWNATDQSGSRAVPIIDLCAKLDLPDTTNPARPAIVVLKVKARTMGLLVHAINGVVAISSSQIEPFPSLHEQVNPSYFAGVIYTPEQIITILDVDELFAEAATELAALRHRN